MLCIRKKGFLLQSNPLKRGSDKRENITTSHPFHLGRFNCSHYGFFFRTREDAWHHDWGRLEVATCLVQWNSNFCGTILWQSILLEALDSRIPATNRANSTPLRQTSSRRWRPGLPLRSGGSSRIPRTGSATSGRSRCRFQNSVKKKKPDLDSCWIVWIVDLDSCRKK